MEQSRENKEKTKRHSLSLLATFWALVGVFAVIAGEFLIPAVRGLFEGCLLFLLPFIVFSLLGMVLIFLTLKEKVEGKLKKFLILTGVSSAGFFISILLHNVFYALGVITGDIAVLSYLMEIIHTAFFIIAIFVCPLGFLIGVLGSVVQFVTKKYYRV